MSEQQPDAIESRVNVLERSIAELREQLEKANLANVRKAVDEWNFWRRIAIAIVPLLGITGLSSVWVAVKHMNESISSMRLEIAGEMKKAEIEAKAEIEDKLDPKVVHDAALQVTIADLKKDFTLSFNDESLTNVQDLLSNTSTFIEMAQQANVPRYLPLLRNPRRLQETQVITESILREYAPKLAAGTIPSNRRKALIFLANALRAHARDSTSDDDAIFWLQHAARADPTFAMPEVLLAHVYIDKAEYLGDQHWSDTAARDKAIDCLARAKEKDQAEKSPEIEKWLPFQMYLAGDFNEAFQGWALIRDREAARKLSGADEKNWLQRLRRSREEDRPLTADDLADLDYDPRLDVWMATLRWAQLRDSAGPLRERRREEAIALSEAAAKKKPVFLSAINNYIWFSTHEFGSHDAVPLKRVPGGKADMELQYWLNVLHENPLSRHYALANTLAEGYVVLAESRRADGASATEYGALYTRAVEHATESEVQAQRFATHRVLELLKNRNEKYVRQVISPLCNGKILPITFDAMNK